MGIEQLLELVSIAGIGGGFQSCGSFGRHGRAQVLQRLHQPLDVGSQRLAFYLDGFQFLSADGGHSQPG